METGGQIPEQHHQLEQQAFNWTKSRIAASERLASALKIRDPQKVREVQDAIVQKGFEGHNRINARGYEENRTRMVYHSPDGKESVSENLVFFVKAGANGEPEMLQNENDKPLFFNASLFDANFSAQSYTVRITEEQIIDVPHVNHQGEITKVDMVRKDLSPSELAQIGMMQPDNSIGHPSLDEIAAKPPSHPAQRLNTGMLAAKPPTAPQAT